MTVNAQEFAPVFQGDALPSSAIKCIRRVKLDANAIGGDKILYGILTNDGAIYVGYNLWLLSRIEFDNVVGLSGWTVTLDSLQMFVAQVSPYGNKAPVLVIGGVYQGGGSPYGNGSSFVATIPLLEPPVPDTIYTPTGTMQFPSRLLNHEGGSSGSGKLEHVDMVGYYGNNTDDLLEFGVTLGWLRGPFAQLGRDGANYGAAAGITSLLSAWVGNSQRVSWVIESPNTHHYRGGFRHGAAVSMMGLPQDDTLGFASFAAPLSLCLGLNRGERMAPGNPWAQESTNFRVLADTLSLDSGRYILTSRNYFGQTPGLSSALSVGGFSFAVPTIPPENRVGSYDGVSLGWGLSGVGAPPVPPDANVIYGGPSLVCYKDANIHIFGDGASSVIATNEYGEARIRALVCAHTGDLEDSFPASGDTFYNAGMVIVIHRQVYFVMSPADLAGVVNTPAYEYTDMPAFGTNENLISVSLEYLYPETNISGYADGWWLVATYINDTGRKVVDVAHSTDGLTWTQEEHIDLDTVLEAAYPDAVSITHQGTIGFGDGKPSIAKITVGMILVISGATVTKADTTVQPVRVQVKRTTVSSGFVVSVLEGSAAPFFNFFAASPELVDSACPDVFLLSGEGKSMVRISHTGAADQAYLDCPAPTSSVDSLGYDDAYEWHAAETATLFQNGIVADSCRPYLLSGVWTPVCFKQGHFSSYAFIPLPGLGVEVVRLMETVSMEEADGTSEYISGKEYSLAFHVSTPDLGTILFLRGPFGEVGHAAFSDSNLAAGYSSPFKITPPREFLNFVHLGFAAYDLFVQDTGPYPWSSSQVYLTDTEGNIRKLTLVTDPQTYHGLEYFTALYTFTDVISAPSLDSLIGNNPLTIFGEYSVDAGQGFGGSCALVLRYTGGAEGYALVNNPETLFTASPTSVRIEFVFSRLDQSRKEWKPLLRVEFDNGRYLEIVYFDSTDALLVRYSNQDHPAGSALATLTRSIFDEERHHLRLEVSGNTIRMGIDGELVAETTETTPAWMTAGTSAVASAIYIGGTPTMSSPSGIIDWVLFHQGQVPWSGLTYPVEWSPSGLGIRDPVVPTSCSFEVVSTHFLGKKNLRLANCDGVWVATYNVPSGITPGQIQGGTYVETSPDMVLWSLAADGSNLNPFMQEVPQDVIPVKEMTRQKPIPAAGADPESVFANIY